MVREPVPPVRRCTMPMSSGCGKPSLMRMPARSAMRIGPTVTTRAAVPVDLLLARGMDADERRRPQHDRDGEGADGGRVRRSRTTGPRIGVIAHHLAKARVRRSTSDKSDTLARDPVSCRARQRFSNGSKAGTTPHDGTAGSTWWPRTSSTPFTPPSKERHDHHANRVRNSVQAPLRWRAPAPLCAVTRHLRTSHGPTPGHPGVRSLQGMQIAPQPWR